MTNENSKLDSERAAFEAWFPSSGLAQSWNTSSGRDLPESDAIAHALSKYGEHYNGCCTHMLWKGWQASAALNAGRAVPDWGVFASYLLDRCEGDTISEEGLQRALHSMVHDPHYGPLFRGEKATAPTAKKDG